MEMDITAEATRYTIVAFIEIGRCTLEINPCCYDKYKVVVKIYRATCVPDPRHNTSFPGFNTYATPSNINHLFIEIILIKVISL